MEQFIIKGGIPLSGIVQPAGNKNAALPMLAACLLTEEPVTLKNMPDIKDVASMKLLLENMGVSIEDIGNNSIIVQAEHIHTTKFDPELCRKIRASILLAGPALARCGELTLHPPGGDVIGRRRVDTHFLALRALGAKAEYNQSKREFQFHAKKLIGSEIILDEASVTATENAIMAAVTAEGKTILRNAASEPHIQELCKFLNKLGARISNIGSNALIIQGVNKLGGGDFTIGSDYLEVVSFIGAAVVTKGSIRIQNASPKYLDMIRMVFNRMGVSWEIEGEDIYVPGEQRLTIEPDLGNAIPEITVMPWPAFPTDLMSIAIVVATQSNGSILFHDWMYPSRMFFIDKLVSMGAQIVLCDPHRCIVNGPSALAGEILESPDIRAGMSLLLAALAAQGTSIIRNVGQIDRGYDSVDKKLRALGASIERVNDK